MNTKEQELFEQLKEIAAVCYKKGVLSVENESNLYEIGKQLAVKTVDMSVLVNSGIDCEFGSRYSLLTGINELGEYMDKTGAYWKHCKPRMNYWFSAENFSNAQQLIDSLNKAGFLAYKILDKYGEIAAFKITGKINDYKWSWEK